MRAAAAEVASAALCACAKWKGRARESLCACVEIGLNRDLSLFGEGGGGSSGPQPERACARFPSSREGTTFPTVEQGRPLAVAVATTQASVPPPNRADAASHAAGTSGRQRISLYRLLEAVSVQSSPLPSMVASPKSH